MMKMRCSASGERSAAKPRPEDLSDNLIVQLGVATEHVNRHWYERNTGHALRDIQRRGVHPGVKWVAGTPDGKVEPAGAGFHGPCLRAWALPADGAPAKSPPPLPPHHLVSTP